MLRKFYFVFGKVNVDFFLKDKNAAFEVVFYFSSLNDEHYRFKFEPSGSYGLPTSVGRIGLFRYYKALPTDTVLASTQINVNDPTAAT